MPSTPSTLAEVRGQIAIMFRALGGEAGVQIAGAKSRKSGHRLGWRQRIGLGDESLDHPGRDGATVFLPDRIALFPDRELNAALYRWLAAWFAIRAGGDDRRGRSVAARSSDLAAGPRDRRYSCWRNFPAWSDAYARLAAAMADGAARRPLPRVEQEVERIVLALLGADAPPEGKLWPAVIGTGELPDEGAARISADAALPAVGRLLDPRGVAADAGDDDDARAGRGGGASRTRASASPSANVTMVPSAIRSC